MLNFIETSGALTAGQLTSTNVGLSFHNVQRKRLEKYGKQYINLKRCLSVNSCRPKMLMSIKPKDRHGDGYCNQFDAKTVFY
jgi:hypothetical protein